MQAFPQSRKLLEWGPGFHRSRTNASYTYTNRLRMSLALSGWTNSYNYDMAGRLTNLTSGAGSFGYAYDNTRLMRVAKLSLPNSAYIANTYDSVSRLASTSLKNSGNNVLDGYTYTLDPLGQRTNFVRDFGLMKSSVAASYDPAGQLSLWVAREANGTARMNELLQYSYDAAGNLSQRFNNYLAQNFAVDPANQLTNITRSGVLTVSGNTAVPASGVTVNGWPAQTYADFTFASIYGYTLADGQNSYTNIATNYYGTATVTNIVVANLPASVILQYDANGNLTNDGARSFSYDAENQLTNVAVAGQWREDFIYDGLNRRRVTREYAWQLGSWTLTNETRFLYDRTAVIQELNSNNVAQVTYTRGHGGLLARTDAAGAVFYHTDGNGNVTGLMDANQYMAARYLYDPFGRLLGKWGVLADANVYRFSSEEMDIKGGLYYCNRRFYEPSFQRWLNRDPIFESGGMNLFAYCGNNPVSLSDPLGLDPLDWLSNHAAQSYQSGGFFANLEGMIANGLQVGLGTFALGDLVKTLATKSGCESGVGNSGAAFGYGLATVGAIAFGGFSFGGGGAVEQASEQTLLRGVDAAVDAERAIQSEFNFVTTDLSGRLSEWNTAAEGTAMRWGPLNGGPLSDAVANTFRGGSYTESALSGETTLYRSYGGTAGELGSYWTRTPPAGPLQATMDSALNPAWGNTAQSVSTIRVPAGTTIYEGFAAPQGGLLGGGSQVYIPKVNPNWLVHP